MGVFDPGRHRVPGLDLSREGIESDGLDLPFELKPFPALRPALGLDHVFLACSGSTEVGSLCSWCLIDRFDKEAKGRETAGGMFLRRFGRRHHLGILLVDAYCA